MKDRELLELAAKAVGYTLYPEWGCAATGILLGKGCETDLQRVWDPLSDDGAALRLVVALRLDIEFDGPRGLHVKYDGPDGVPCMVDEYLSSKDAASDLRRAIVLAAAEIGKNIGQQS